MTTIEWIFAILGKIGLDKVLTELDCETLDCAVWTGTDRIKEGLRTGQNRTELDWTELTCSGLN